MTTFAYRDLRRGRVEAALAALDAGGDPDGLRPGLERELEILAGDDWRVTDRAYRAVAADSLWATRERVRDSVAIDPVLRAVGAVPALTDAQAAAIEGLVHGAGTGPPGYLERVEGTVGNDEAILAEIVHAAHRAWLDLADADSWYPFADVGVLLPLRLETLFDPPLSRFNDDPTRWKLSLRVIPDEASICRDDPYVSDGELAALRRFWAAVRAPGPFDPAWLDGAQAGVAWAMLAGQVTPARAAWLVASVLPVVDGEDLLVEPPADMPPESQPNRVGGLPPNLSVWGITVDAGGVETPHDIGTLPMDTTTTIGGDALTMRMPTDQATAREAWWASWPAAVKAGLGGEWLLEDGLAPDTLAGIRVAGLGDEPPDEHFRAQADAGELGVLRLGSPTNTVHGAPAADLALDDATWLRVARARIGRILDPDARPAAPAGDAIALHLTGSAATVPPFPGADLPDETLDSQRMAKALWPALQGQWLAEVWGVRDDAFRVARWAFPPASLEVSSQEVIEVLHHACEDGIRPAPARNLCPEGPLMPVRIGDQPYGLLPVTCLADWQPSDAFDPDPEQHRVEQEMARALVNVRAAMAATGRRNGNVVGESTERFMDLLARDAVTRRFIARMFAPASVWALPFVNVAADSFEQTALDLYRPAAEVMGRLPEVPYLANGAWRTIRLPLVRPTRTIHRFDPEQRDPRRVSLTRFLAIIVDQLDQMGLPEIFERHWMLDPGSETRIRTLPDSLLIRLLVHSCQVTARWLSLGFGDQAALPILLGVLEAVRDIGCELDQPAWNAEERDPDTGEPLYRIQTPAERTARLEGALRATIDTAAHRIDPWVTGFAWQRLRESAFSERGTHRLGAYGWVDGPFIGTPGPTAAGRLHAPSYNQALAAIVLRDKFLSAGRAASVSEGGRNPWEMNISSRKARLAEELADEVRLGFHIYEIVGRRVEHVIGTHQGVKELRTNAKYAMRAERLDPNEVCNGIDALAGLLAGDPDFPLDVKGQRAELELLRAALDTYGDLLVADGVMQLINRQADRAAETMDAAAGFSRPPTFEFLRTPASGYQLDSLVLGVAAYVPPSAVGPDASPIRIAEPSLGAFLEARLGGAWTWKAVNDDDETGLGSAALADMGLGPLDALALSADFLAELARRTMGLPLAFVREGRLRAWDVTDAVGGPLGRVSTADLGLLPADLAAFDEAALRARITTHLGVPADSVVTEVVFADPREQRIWIAEDGDRGLLGIATLATLGISADEAEALAEPDLHKIARVALGVPRVRVDAPAEHELARHFVAALGDRPAAGRDVIRDPATQRATDAAVYAELAERYTALHGACQALIDDIGAALDDVARTVLIRRALGWGVTVMGEPMDREALFAALTGAPEPVGSRPLRDLAAKTAAALDARLKAAPTPADLLPDAAGSRVPNHEDRKRDGRPDGVPSLAQAIASLASPQRRLAILACWPREALLANTNLDVAQPDADLDEAWLTVVAAVRPALARLEALQLELAPTLGAWSSSPGDPWRAGADAPVQANRRRREEESVAQMSMTDRLAAAYGTADAWAGENVAVGLIDAFGESIPMAQRSTMTAFGFNAPAARPPQAILLAVPPKERQRLDDDLVQRILAETRELAHARTVRVEDLGALQTIAQTAWMSVSGNDAVRLEPYPLFD